MRAKIRIAAIIISMSASALMIPSRGQAAGQFEISETAMDNLAQLSLTCINSEFPNKTSHIVESREEKTLPHELHPIFFGCYDWHSAVHGHWALARVLKISKNNELRSKIIALFNQQFQDSKVRDELKYFSAGAGALKFERPYGYGWFLRLLTELRTLDIPQAQAWISALAPLEKRIVELYLISLSKYDFPVRTGLHENTAFSMSHALDYAAAVGDQNLTQAISAQARRFYFADPQCPISYEPSGEDFLSPCLAEADLMTRVLSKDELANWLHRFFDVEHLSAFLQPISPPDLQDLRTVHLVGLNFQKAWTMRRIAMSLPENHELREKFLTSAGEHSRLSRRLIFDTSYAGKHWLGSFALFELTDANLGEMK